MWFADNTLQSGVPAFNMIICSGPIVVVVVPLLESELAIDPCGVKVGYEMFNVVHLRGLLLNSLPCYSHKAMTFKEVIDSS